MTNTVNEQFELGLFENPYVDPVRASYVIGNRTYQRKAEEAQRKSIVMLENKDKLLPIEHPTENKEVTLYTMGMNPDVVSHDNWNNYQVINGAGDTLLEADEADYAVIRVNVTNKSDFGALDG